MSFVRPESRRLLWQWREVILSVCVALIGLWLVLRGAERASVVLQGLGASVAIVAVLFLYPAVQRARFFQNKQAPGLVEVTERRIGYLGPTEGTFVAIDALTKLEIRKSEAFGTVWVLYHSEGPAVVIPTAAKGSEDLYDAFSALSVIDVSAMIRATKTRDPDTIVIWQA